VLAEGGEVAADLVVVNDDEWRAVLPGQGLELRLGRIVRGLLTGVVAASTQARTALGELQR
jgi:hypothetical protein